MRVVIVGAGAIGQEVASLLSIEHNDVILVDHNASLLERVSQDLDIATRVGSGTDWNLQEELMESLPDLFLALTESDEINLICCAIAKALGYPSTMARVRHWRYLNQTRLDFGRLFAVDHFVSPELWAVQAILKPIMSLGSLHIENFALGAVQMRTVQVPQKWKRIGKPLKELDLPEGVMVAIICRTRPSGKGKPAHERYELIFPHGDDSFQAEDEVTFIGKTAAIEQVHNFLNIPHRAASSAMIIGGGLIGFQVARSLSEKGVDVRLVDSDPAKCTKLSELLPRVTVLHHDGTDLNFLLAEKAGAVDVFLPCTRRDEINLLSALQALEAGCENVISVMQQASSAVPFQRLGITHFVSPRRIAANRILSIAQAKTVIGSSTMYDNRAKVLELLVSSDSKLTGIPLSDLGPMLPKDFLFATIQNRGRMMIAHGGRVLSPGDTVIAVMSPEHTEQILGLF